MPEEEEEEEDEDADKGQPRKRAKFVTEPQPERVWKKEDIQHPLQDEYRHPKPEAVLLPYQYFQKLFTLELLDTIVYQTNLYARQRNVSTSSSTACNELLVFIGCLIFMGIVQLPSIEDYWAFSTRIPQVAGAMSSKRLFFIYIFLKFNKPRILSCVSFTTLPGVIYGHQWSWSKF